MGGACEYESYDGECSFAGLDAKPNDGDPDLLWVTVRHHTLGKPFLTPSEQTALPRWELEELRAHYDDSARVRCKVSQIRKGTCVPETASYERNEFRVPGSTGREPPPCSPLAQCVAKCTEAPAGLACDRAGYLLRYGVGVPVDREASNAHYRAALKPVLGDCKAGIGRACMDVANRAEHGFGTDPDPQLAVQIYGMACKLGEPAGCLAFSRARKSRPGPDAAAPAVQAADAAGVPSESADAAAGPVP